MGVTYATHDSVALAGDLYLPKGAGPFPALVGVHGGGWVQGARDAFQHWGPYLAARGVALFAISYRLAKTGQKTFPHAVQDVLAAIQFVRGNAKDCNIAPDRIGIFGHSAGGNIGALAALGGSSPLFANGYPNDPFASVSTEVKVFAGIYGVYDVARDVEKYNAQKPEREQHREVPRRVAAGEPPALFRRLADQLRDHRQQQDRGASERSAPRTIWSIARPTPTRSCWR